MEDDYNAADDGARSYLVALEDKRQRGSMGNWENRPWKRVERIGPAPEPKQEGLPL
jgi:hypothetical protein